MNIDENFVYLSKYIDIRCPVCNKVLAKVSEDTRGTLHFRCVRCKNDVIIPFRVRASEKAR